MLLDPVRWQNMRRVARELGENLSEEELQVRRTCMGSRGPECRQCLRPGGCWYQAMIDEFDKDQDGEINEDEFITIMKGSSSY